MTREQTLLKDLFNACASYGDHSEMSIPVEVYNELSTYLVEQKLIPAYHFLPLLAEDDDI